MSIKKTAKKLGCLTMAVGTLLAVGGVGAVMTLANTSPGSLGRNLGCFGVSILAGGLFSAVLVGLGGYGKKKGPPPPGSIV